MNSKQENILRKSIRHAIKTVKGKRQAEDKKLRGVIRELLDFEMKALNEAATPDNDPAPHRSTGINVLEDLLKKIVPVLEDDYKLLTTNDEQRRSFRAHIVNAVIGSLTPVEANNDAGEVSEDIDEEISVDVGGNDDDKFIDIRTDAEKSAEEPEEEKPVNSFGIDGEDETGRNMAYASYKKIESSVVDAYDLLSNSEDQEIFYEYLIANLKLYFDKFEGELASNPTEPTNQAYDSAAQGAGMDDQEEVIDFQV
tara:strand:+ start:365 stop:1126 length:762 start_codon:yes stop_codon:yes gene_type:complete